CNQGVAWGPTVAAWIVDLGSVCGLRTEGRGLRTEDCGAAEGVAAAEDVELAAEHAGAWHVITCEQIGACGPGVGGDVVVIEGVEGDGGGIAPARDVEVAVDHAIAGTAEGGWHIHAGGIEGVGNGVVLPHLALGACDLTGVIAADEVYLGVVVA